MLRNKISERLSSKDIDKNSIRGKIVASLSKDKLVTSPNENNINKKEETPLSPEIPNDDIELECFSISENGENEDTLSTEEMLDILSDEEGEELENIINEVEQINNEEDIIDEDTINEPIVIWGTAPTTLSKGNKKEIDIVVEKPGKYKLEFRNMDKIGSRILNIEVILSSKGKELTKTNGNLGGIKRTKNFIMEFKTFHKSDINIKFTCGNITNIGRVKFIAALYYLQGLDNDELEIKKEEPDEEIIEESKNKENMETNKSNEKTLQNENMKIVKEDFNDSIPTIVWELPETSLSKNEQHTESFFLEKPGCYQLIFTKLDKVALRSLSFDIFLLRNGNIVSKGAGGLGGVKYTKRHCMEFQLSEPTQVKMDIKCTNFLAFGSTDFKIACFHSTLIHGKPLKIKKSSELEEDTNVTNENENDIIHEDINDSNEILANIKEFTFSNKKVLNHTLTAGHYYIGIRNDDSRVGDRSFSIHLKVSQANNEEILLEESCEALNKGDFPWRQWFSVTPEQEPVTCKLSLKTATILEGKVSIKMSRTPDPKSIPEVLKRTKNIQFKIAGIIVLLLFLSYGSQIVSFIFALPLGKMTVRGILTIFASIFCFYHKDELLHIIKENANTIKDKLSFFKGLDELETGIQKIKYLQERSKVKRIKLLARKKKQMIL